MDYQAYREAYFEDPIPKQRFSFKGIYGATLFYHDYEEAVLFYEQVLGLPAYIEGESTKGWRLGDTWLTLLRARDENPRNVEVQVVVNSVREANRLQHAFIDAGGAGQKPSKGLMYEPVYMCPVSDPFGVQIMIVCKVDEI